MVREGLGISHKVRQGVRRSPQDQTVTDNVTQSQTRSNEVTQGQIGTERVTQGQTRSDEVTQGQIGTDKVTQDQARNDMSHKVR